MSANRPKLAFSGDTSGPLATQLEDYVELVPFDGTPASAPDGLLLDGQADAAADEGVLKAALDSGKLLAVASPGDGISEILLALTGQTPGPGAPLVTYRRSAGRAGYDCMVLPPLKVTSSAYSESGAVGGSAVESSPAPKIGSALVRALSAPSGAGPAATTLSTAGLVPPPGALAGYNWCYFIVTPTYGYPSINNKPDDSTVQTNNQAESYQLTNQFYVYWVNGSATAQPYYVVILRQTGPMSLGNMVANNSNSLGWFQAYFRVHPNTVHDINGQPLTNGVSLDAYAPTTSSGEATISIQEPMWLYAKTGSGPGPVQFTAQVNDSLDLPGWAILDQTSGPNTSWEYYQTDTWNTVTNPYHDFANWWSQVYGNNDMVDPMPAASYGSIAYEGYTVWKFTPPLFTPPTPPYFTATPPSLTVQFRGRVRQHVFLLHNIAGCLGADGSTHHHLFALQSYWHWHWQFDLSQVVQLQNIAS